MFLKIIVVTVLLSVTSIEDARAQRTGRTSFGDLKNVTGSLTNLIIFGPEGSKINVSLTIGSFTPEAFSPSLVNFRLYTKKNPSDPATFQASASERFDVSKSNFDHKHPTKIFIHGYGGHPGQTIFHAMKSAYFDIGETNVIILDWAFYAKPPNYEEAVLRSAEVGAVVAKFVDFLPYCSKVHIIGYSLGAHTAGFAGKFSRRKILRITGLDPAGPGFDAVPSSKRLSRDDASFVDVIHTDAGSIVTGNLAINFSIGHADFYPNGGRNQPGCGKSDVSKGIIDGCSHSYAPLFFYLSIANRTFSAKKCSSNDLENDTELMGESVSLRARGDYCLTVLPTGLSRSNVELLRSGLYL